jgi:hypothetical protein
MLQGAGEVVSYYHLESDHEACENSHAPHTRIKSLKATLSTSSEGTAKERSRQHAWVNRAVNERAKEL